MHNVEALSLLVAHDSSTRLVRIAAFLAGAKVQHSNANAISNKATEFTFSEPTSVHVLTLESQT